MNDDAPAPADDPAARTVLVWVDGRVPLRPWEDERRAWADRLAEAAAALGLLAQRAPLPDGADPDDAPVRRRWSSRRVGAGDLRRYVESRPGVTFEALLVGLYYEAPWTDARAAAARGKLRVALHRLAALGGAVKRYDDAGVERWAPPGVATDLRLSAAGPAAPRPAEARLPRALLADQLEAGAAVLRRLRIFDDDALAGDPHLYHDLVRAVVEAAQPTGDIS